MINAPRFFQALADTTRLRCLMLIVTEGYVCVCEMAYALGEIQPKISRHLAAMRATGLVLDCREGQWMYYRLHPDLPAWMDEVLTTCNRTLANQLPFSSDRAALAVMPNRPKRQVCQI
ncbi:MAG TPA: metalloregulator ArsR/SmtB family transcription factor [Candidatus Competibacteraceae bacterium]|nr:metalloregulator ArsR/SmtB family transcription factor [Candidatus Competibacteraceae bacterium]MCP5134727.1 metalloregulator ArsR/SmtB family transcription factor [Gammaproteobacteria bacterium]HPF59855.1 metalloregulator ArsR/SmtB family transcription factor [Candidatus Competibacteraceae bacterium]HRY18787.1 metalloregulator ArsR/SmtB family transcription factor [Candidatus Competibacteraceae bacterium]